MGRRRGGRSTGWLVPDQVPLHRTHPRLIVSDEVSRQGPLGTTLSSSIVGFLPSYWTLFVSNFLFVVYRHHDDLIVMFTSTSIVRKNTPTERETSSFPRL